MNGAFLPVRMTVIKPQLIKTSFNASGQNKDEKIEPSPD